MGHESKQVKSFLPSPAQTRGARAMLGWSQERLATASGLSGPTVKRFETEGARVSDEAVAKMRSALEAAGVIFLDEGEMRDGGPGVRLRR